MYERVCANAMKVFFAAAVCPFHENMGKYGEKNDSGVVFEHVLNVGFDLTKLLSLSFHCAQLCKKDEQKNNSDSNSAIEYTNI